MKLKALISDDEASARSRLRKLLAAHAGVEIIGEASDGLQTVEMIERLDPNIIFLDVQMPGLNGFEVLRNLGPEKAPPLVVFVTSYDEYALAAFEANAVSYLLKPVNRDNLARAIERAQKLIESAPALAQEQGRLRATIESAAPRFDRILARIRDRYVLLRLDQIFFFRIEEGLVRVRTEDGAYWTDYKLSDLQRRLPDPPFFRAHRSSIVNLSKVREVVPLSGTYVLVMSDRERSEVEVSERQSKTLRSLLGL